MATGSTGSNQNPDPERNQRPRRESMKIEHKIALVGLILTILTGVIFPIVKYLMKDASIQPPKPSGSPELSASPSPSRPSESGEPWGPSADRRWEVYYFSDVSKNVNKGIDVDNSVTLKGATLRDFVVLTTSSGNVLFRLKNGSVMSQANDSYTPGQCRKTMSTTPATPNQGGNTDIYLKIDARYCLRSNEKNIYRLTVRDFRRAMEGGEGWANVFVEAE